MSRIFFSLIVIFAPIFTFSQGNQGYTINGNIKGLTDATKFFLIRSTNGNADTISIAASNKGKFIFKGTLDDEGELYFIKMDTTSFPISANRNSWMRLFLENREIQITGEAKIWPDVKVSGSKSTKVFEYIEQRAKLYDKELKAAKNSEDSIREKELIRAYKFFLDSIVNYEKDLYASSSILLFFKRGVLSGVEQHALFEKLSDKVKNSFYGKRWEEQRAISETRTKLREGAILVDFSFMALNGKVENILELIKDSEFTLIDFWASWCAPCRNEVPELKKIYARYGRENFNIIGVSVMDTEAGWRGAIEKDGAMWKQGFDWDNSITKLFGFNSLPAYLLVDRNGKLLAYESSLSGVPSFGKKIRGTDLEDTMKDLIKTNRPM